MSHLGFKAFLIILLLKQIEKKYTNDTIHVIQKRISGQEVKMKSFPGFIKNPKNQIDPSQQNTKDIEGYYFEGKDDSQIAFWECFSNRESKPHVHDFDEYILCVRGEYTAIIEGKEIVLNPGDELLIPKGTVQGGKIKAGTRTIHAFGGKRIK